MNMRWIVVISSLLLAFSTLAVAQQGPGKGQGKGRPSLDQRVDRLVEELDLDDEQSVQVREIMREAQASRPNVRIMDREEAKPAMCKHMLTTDLRIKGVLTESQVEQYDAFKESRKAGLGGGRGRGPVDCSEFETAD